MDEPTILQVFAKPIKLFCFNRPFPFSRCQVNASTLLDFFNHLGKSPSEAGGSSGGGRFGNGNGALDRVAVKEEPLSEEDLRALQKDRQKKDNHNMSNNSYT